jgi:hypothetical protein
MDSVKHAAGWQHENSSSPFSGNAHFDDPERSPVICCHALYQAVTLLNGVTRTKKDSSSDIGIPVETGNQNLRVDFENSPSDLCVMGNIIVAI